MYRGCKLSYFKIQSVVVNTLSCLVDENRCFPCGMVVGERKGRKFYFLCRVW